jgi:nitroreductase
MHDRAQHFFHLMNARRSVRHFSDEPVPESLVAWAIRTAGTAPSGAHRQPWRFVAVNDPDLKHQIREAAEREEYAFYHEGRASREWLDAVAPLGTDWRKPYLETAPWLVVVFELVSGVDGDGKSVKNYYVKESVGIACGLFLAALHQMGLATLTHTPSPMDFLTRILGRPRHERPFILFPIGYPATGATVPDLDRKQLDEIAVWHRATTPS